MIWHENVIFISSFILVRNSVNFEHKGNNLVINKEENLAFQIIGKRTDCDNTMFETSDGLYLSVLKIKDFEQFQSLKPDMIIKHD